jgi:carbon dioxide concentrating mechanism protein CcmO
MPSHSKLPAPFDHQPPPPEQHYSDSALGLVATKSFPAIVGTADMMLKSAEVTLVGYEKIGSGHCTAIVRGKTADVRLAVEEGAKTAEQFGQLIAKLVIPRPMPNLEAVFPIGTRLAELAQQKQGYSRLSNRAIGLLETRGFPAMVAGADAMLKAADVQLASYETIGEGLCTAIIRGSVADVAMAIEVGMQEAERVGELHAVMVIPRLMEDLEHTIPVAKYWLEEQPLSLPEKQKETEQERQPLSLPQRQEETEEEPQPVSQQEEEEETAEAESETEQERPLVELPELEKIDYPEPGQEQQQQKRQQAPPPEEES